MDLELDSLYCRLSIKTSVMTDSTSVLAWVGDPKFPNINLISNDLGLPFAFKENMKKHITSRKTDEDQDVLVVTFATDLHENKGNKKYYYANGLHTFELLTKWSETTLKNKNLNAYELLMDYHDKKIFFDIDYSKKWVGRENFNIEKHNEVMKTFEVLFKIYLQEEQNFDFSMLHRS